ncbi:MAG: sigma-70 family RNA polymerase sigma factor [Lachnospiraceae bacterium]|jgi:RNA polymerase sigma-70 factor (ECF subfamily)|nr:sigma-70 family RNA polymerase sigma factor [Lachnospiraceae bacterium]
MKKRREADAIKREEQLEILIDRYQNLIFSICYKMTADYFISEDLAQETFLSAYEKYSSFDGKNEKAWICRIATNKCLDYLKHSGRKTIPTEDTYFSYQEDTGQSPEEACLEEEVRNELYCCCKNLKPPYDEIALDYYYYELDVGEIAKKRNRNAKTVQTQIYRARGMLRKHYKKKEESA